MLGFFEHGVVNQEQFAVAVNQFAVGEIEGGIVAVVQAGLTALVDTYDDVDFLA